MNRLLPLAAMLLAAPAAGQELREFCGDRPGLGTPACTVDPGHVQAELGGVDWTHDRTAESVEDQVVAGDLLLRYGLDARTEARIGWTAYGHDRERDRATGEVERRSGTGDMTLGIKRNLANPDGRGLSAAVLPYVSLPVGRRPIGAGDWGAGLLVPVDYDLSDKLQLQLTPEVDAAVDEDGDGRHLAYGSVLGLSYQMTEALTGSAEVAAVRDRDPAMHATMTQAALSLAWQPNRRTQLDVGATAGLDHRTPDAELYIGLSEKF